ncbi:MAG TPA: hypothetical protein VFI06_03060 [Chitinophagaceae bacterium]|nr:hypothetical protein [Chitinophagaceae bacterium]
MRKFLFFCSFAFTINSYAQNCPSHLLNNDTTVFVICSNETVDLTNIIQTRGLTIQWDISNPTVAILGVYRLTVDSSGCRDTVFVTVRQDIKTWLGTASDNWHDPLNWTGNSVPNDKTHVIINNSTLFPCVIRDNDATAASIQVEEGANYSVMANKNLAITAQCEKLPPLMEMGSNTIIINTPTAQLIQFIDSSTIVFNGTTPQLQNLESGIIILCGIAPNAPFGFLRKIISKQTTGSTTTLITSETTLTETFKELHLDYRKVYSDNDTLQRTTTAVPFTISIPQIILHDEDGNTNTTSDQIKFDGSLQVTPDFRFHIDISNFRLNSASIEAGFENILTNSITVGSNVSNITKEKVIYSKPLALWYIPGTILIIVPTLEVRIGAVASLNVGMSASNTNTNRVVSYLKYENHDWSVGYNGTMQNQFNFSGINGSAEAQFYVEPSIAFKLYGSNWAKGSIDVDAYLKITGQLFPTQSCELTAGISASAEANLGFFGNDYPIASYPDIFDFSQILYTCPVTEMPSVSTTSVTGVTSSSASSGGNVTSDGGGTVTARGVCWSTSPNPTTANNKSTDGSGTGSFTSSITGLSPSTLYYVRAYATNGAGTAYGNSVSFNTPQAPAQLPTVSTTSITGVTSSSASSGGNVTSDGGGTVTSRGVCWSTSPNPTTANNKTTDGSGTGSFTSSITGLSPSTLYYVRAYAANGAGTAYGNSVSFNTPQAPAQLPTVSTTSITGVTSSSASSGGNVTSDGGATVTSRGVCWNTSPNPTTANSKTTNGSGTGSFTSSITGLSPSTLYYVRAYATNSAGTAYGNSLNFTSGSAAPIPITPTDACTSPPIMQVNTVYQVNINVANYTLGAPISGQSAGGASIRGFWVAVSVPVGYYATSVVIYDVSSNFNPVVGLKSNCSFDYYPNTSTGSDYANALGNGGSETFGTGLTGPDASNDGIYHIRIYHYTGSETPTISFKIKVQ